MKDFTLEVYKRDRMGSSNSRRFRRDGTIPAVIYSKGRAALPIIMEERAFCYLASSARPSQVFKFKSEDAELKEKTAIVKDMQLEPLKGKVLHVDFFELHADEEVEIQLPLEIIGEAPGVKNEGGILTIQIRELNISCLPAHIPTVLEVDISELALGQRIKVGDLQMPEGVKLVDDPEETVVNVVSSRATIEEEEAAAEAEAGEEGAEAAAEGEEAKGEEKKGDKEEASDDKKK